MLLEALGYGLVIAFFSVLFLGFRDGKFDLKKTLTVNIVGTILLGLLFAVFFYLGPLAFVGIWAGWYRVLAAPVFVVSFFWILINIGREAVEGKEMLFHALKIAVVVIFGLVILTTPYFHDKDLYNIPQVTEIQNLSAPNGILDPIDLKHVRLVDQDLAYSLGHNVIGGSSANLGSMYKVKKEEFHIQIVKGHEFWVAPLEFQDYWKWSAKGSSPGFVMIDAEDPYAEPKLYTGYDMKYMPSAYWGKYLYRYLYSSGYSNVKLEDFTFEVTDELLPRWTVSKTKPTINNDGYIVESVVSVDPESGKIEEYSVGNVPEWIDRVTPERIAIDYATWRGAFVHGWWNAYGIFVTHEDVNEVTTVYTEGGRKQEMFFVYGSDKKPYWFSGMTSPSYGDQSLTSIVLVDAREPTRMLRLQMTGANEQAALDAVNSKFSAYPNWYGTATIPYNIYGTLTYIIPYDAHTDSGNIYQGVGFVDAMTKHAVIAETKEKAVEGYKSYLASRNVKVALTSEVDLKSLEGEVKRIGAAMSDGQSSYRVFLENSDIIFSINPNLFPEVSLTNVGDLVNITYIDTADTVVGVNKFDNRIIDARIGKDQIALDKETANLTKQVEENWDVQQEYQKKIEELRK